MRRLNLKEMLYLFCSHVCKLCSASMDNVSYAYINFNFHNRYNIPILV
jgi:hypothetical protein